ncbi:MAG: protein BatD [Bacteroidetes bacterium]|nr:protein BatD [Bacteroidota bacterium]
MKKAWYIKLFLFAVVFVLPPRLIAQKNKAVLSRKTISMSETTELTITAEGDQIISAFSGPTSPGVMVISNFTQQNNVNGHVQVVQHFVLQPLQPGTWTLGPFVAQGRRGPVRIPAVTLVVKGQPVSAGFSGKEIFLQSDIAGRTFYEGEEIAVNVRLYVQENCAWRQGMMPLSSPSYVGFWHERGPEGIRFDDTMIVKNGKRYFGSTLLREFLFASRTGTLTIPAFEYECMLISAVSNGYQTETPVKLLSDPHNLQIKQFPAGAPPGFSHLAGAFNLRASLDKPRVKAFDVVTLRITISGQGNLRTLQLPPPVLPDSIDLLPGRSDDSTTVTAFGVLGYKVFTWTLIPKHPGKYLLDSVNFVYFSADRNTYITLTTPPFELHVDPADPSTLADAGSAQNTDTGSPSNENGLTWLYLGLIVVPVGALTWLWWWRMRKRIRTETPRPSPAPDVPVASATPVMQLTLAQLTRELRQQAPAEFIRTLYTCWHNELCHLAGISSPSASIHTIRYALSLKNYPDTLVEEALRPLEALALLRFSEPDEQTSRYWLEECQRLHNLLKG